MATSATLDTLSTATFMASGSLDTVASVTFFTYVAVPAEVVFIAAPYDTPEVFRPGDNVKYNYKGLTGEAIVSAYYNNLTYQIQLVSCSNWSAVTDGYLIVPITALTPLSPPDWVNW